MQLVKVFENIAHLLAGSISHVERKYEGVGQTPPYDVHMEYQIDFGEHCDFVVSRDHHLLRGLSYNVIQQRLSKIRQRLVNVIAAYMPEEWRKENTEVLGKALYFEFRFTQDESQETTLIIDCYHDKEGVQIRFSENDEVAEYQNKHTSQLFMELFEFDFYTNDSKGPIYKSVSKGSHVPV